MVSFSCECCGDVLTKKKLDPHHRQCQGSSFTCLDCMTHFRGTDYRTHTSCVSEDQKYQGALYKENPSKQGKKPVKISKLRSQRPRSAYVEDAPDVDSGNTITIVDPPPSAPSPPSAKHKQPAQPINVFDFLVTGDTPNATPTASKISLGGPNESMKMVEQAPKVFGHVNSHGPQKASRDIHHDDSYETQGYSYGEDPVPVKAERPMIEYITPGPKDRQNGSKESLYDYKDTAKKSTDKKRKRLHVEELDLTAARRPNKEPDALMADAPPAILHSGLTGGLNRLLSNSKFPPSPDYSNGDPSPPSPVKRSKHTVKEKDGRGRKASSHAGTLVKVRKRRSSDESRPRKHHRSHHSPEHHRHHDHHDRPKRKAIEYPSQPHPNDSQQQLVVFKSRAELFMSFVTKGPESEQGYSVHKALKRYHRERGEQSLGLEKIDEEKELFKGLRLKRNERGEIVVFF